MAKNIAIGLDGSKSSWEAFEQSLSLAVAMNAVLHIVSVREGLEPSYSASELIHADHDAVDNLQKIQNKAKELAKSQEISVNTVILKENPIESIVKYVKENQVEILVMGHKGHSSLIDALLGNQVEKLIRYAPCSVMVVRGQ